MQTRTTETLFDNQLSFKLHNLNHDTRLHSNNSLSLETFTPCIAQHVAQTIAMPTDSLTINFDRNAFREIEKLTFKISMVSTAQTQSINEEHLQQAIKDACQAVYDDNRPAFSDAEEIEWHSTPSEKTSKDYHWKVQLRSYQYDLRGLLTQSNIVFVDETKHSYLYSSNTIEMSYNFDNLATITPKYNEWKKPSAEFHDKLCNEAKAIIQTNYYTKPYQPYLNALQSGHYNLALRRACYLNSNQQLELLLKHDNNNQLNLNYNQASSNGLTALDYLYKSKNEAAIAFCRERGFKTKDELKLELNDSQRIKIVQTNNENRARRDSITPSLMPMNPHTPGLNAYHPGLFGGPNRHDPFRHNDPFNPSRTNDPTNPPGFRDPQDEMDALMRQMGISRPGL